MPASRVCLVLLLAAQAASGAVIQCRDATGGMHFNQFYCPPGTQPIERRDAPPGNLSIIATAPLSDDERRALADLAKMLEADRRARAGNRQRAARSQAARKKADAALCSDALRHLEALADTRRRGYAASAEGRLEAEEARWRAAKKAAC